jgi:hypothetical protein
VAARSIELGLANPRRNGEAALGDLLACFEGACRVLCTFDAQPRQDSVPDVCGFFARDLPAPGDRRSA